MVDPNNIKEQGEERRQKAGHVEIVVCSGSKSTQPVVCFLALPSTNIGKFNSGSVVKRDRFSAPHLDRHLPSPMCSPSQDLDLLLQFRRQSESIPSASNDMHDAHTPRRQVEKRATHRYSAGS